jgi:GAF domain-containing protein
MQGRTINTSVPLTSGEVRASLAVPLVSGGNTLGALYLDDPRRRLFEATDVQLAQVASTVLSLLLEEVHLERILNQQRFLQELTQDLSSVETEEEIAKWILPRLVARLGFDRTALLLVAPDAQHLILSHARGQGFADVPPALMRQRRRGGRFAIPLLPEEAILRRLRTPFQTFLLTEIRNAGAAALEALADGTRVRIQSRPLVALLRYLRCSSCVVAPCAVQDTLLGVLVVERRRGPTEQDQRYLRFVAARSSASMGPSLPPPTPT